MSEDSPGILQRPAIPSAPQPHIETPTPPVELWEPLESRAGGSITVSQKRGEKKFDDLVRRTTVTLPDGSVEFFTPKDRVAGFILPPSEIIVHTPQGEVRLTFVQTPDDMKSNSLPYYYTLVGPNGTKIAGEREFRNFSNRIALQLVPQAALTSQDNEFLQRYGRKPGEQPFVDLIKKIIENPEPYLSPDSSERK